MELAEKYYAIYGNIFNDKELFMSRIGKRDIILDPKIDVKIHGCTIIVEGPKGKLQHKIPEQISVKKKDNKLKIDIKKYNKKSRELYGLSRTLINNMVTGASEEFWKILQIQGVGYRAQLDNDQNLILNIGYSHPIYMTIPNGITVEVNNNTEIKVKGINKESVGQFAAQIRLKRPPEPYKGKGIRYEYETIRKKVGKAGK